MKNELHDKKERKRERGREREGGGESRLDLTAKFAFISPTLSTFNEQQWVILLNVRPAG